MFALETIAMMDAVSRTPLANARIALIAFLVGVLLFLNAWFPWVRFESQAANIRFGMILDWLPICVGVFALCSVDVKLRSFFSL